MARWWEEVSTKFGRIGFSVACASFIYFLFIRTFYGGRNLYKIVQRTCTFDHPLSNVLFF